MKKKGNLKKTRVKTLFEKFEQSKIKLRVVFFAFLGFYFNIY